MNTSVNKCTKKINHRMLCPCRNYGKCINNFWSQQNISILSPGSKMNERITLCLFLSWGQGKGNHISPFHFIFYKGETSREEFRFWCLPPLSLQKTKAGHFFQRIDGVASVMLQCASSSYLHLLAEIKFWLEISSHTTHNV